MQGVEMWHAPVETRQTMARFIWGAALLLVAIWVFFALARAVSAFIHLALVVAIILVAYNLLTSLRHRRRGE